MKKYQIGILCAVVTISPLFGTAKVHAEEVLNIDTSIETNIDNNNIISEDIINNVDNDTQDDLDNLNNPDNIDDLNDPDNPDNPDNQDDPDVDPEPILNGWQTIDGKKYFYVDNIPLVGFQSVENKPYYFDKNGVMQTSWFTIKNNKYYANNNGVLVTGKQIIEKYTYIFDKTHVMKTGWTPYNNNWYFLDSNGHAKSGWIQDNNKWYYFDKNFKMVKGWQTIKNKKYWFNEHGVMATGWKTISEKKYYFGTSGVVHTGWKTINKKKYYFSANGVMQIGWRTINNKKYYFGVNGAMQDGMKTINNKKYYFKKGVLQTGWQKISGKQYYFGKNGAMLMGWQKISNKWYFFKSGVMQSAQWFKSKSNLYYLYKDGHAAINEVVVANNKARYLDADGIARTFKGWKQLGKKWYYADANGNPIYNSLKKIDGVIYNFRSDAVAKKSNDQLAAEKALSLGNLKAAFDYVKTSYKWGGRNTWDEHDTSKSLAEFGIKNNWGNCFVYAGAFREMAYELGYDAHQVWGVVPYPGNRVVKHSWVEIVIDGTTYVYDPEASWQFKKDFYKFQYGDKGTFRYEVRGRMN